MSAGAFDDNKSTVRHLIETTDMTDIAIAGEIGIHPDNVDAISLVRQQVTQESETDDSGRFEPYGFDGSADDVREHYDRIRPVYETLSRIQTDDDSYHTTWIAGHDRWYVDEQKRFDGPIDRRAYTFDRDYDRLINECNESRRTVHVITTWKDKRAAFQTVREHDRDDFESGACLGDYPDVRGVTIWADIDLEDKGSRFDMTDEDREAVEADLSDLVDSIAGLLELEADDIALFDSGGGAYPFAPAAVTLPIAEYYSGEAQEVERGRVMEEIIGRINAHLHTAWEPQSGLLSVDAELNKNRQTKAPLAIHKSKDVLVAPARDADGNIDYTPTPVENLTDHLISQTVEECERIVSDDERYRNAVEPLVCNLFDEYEGTWQERLDAWNADKWAEERDKIHERARRKRRRQERRERRQSQSDIDVRSTPDFDGEVVTGDITTVYAAIDEIPIDEAVRKYIAEDWNTADRSSETNFNPTYRNSGSGKSCFITPHENTFGDNQLNAGGGPLTACAIHHNVISDPTQRLTGELFYEAIRCLRNDGYPIPVMVTPADRTDDGKMPYSSVKDAAIAMDICRPDEFVERESDDGGTYRGFPSQAVYNATLEQLYIRGIETGRDLAGDGESKLGPRAYLEESSDDDVDDEAVDELLNIFG